MPFYFADPLFFDKLGPAFAVVGVADLIIRSVPPGVLGGLASASGIAADIVLPAQGTRPHLSNLGQTLFYPLDATLQFFYLFFVHTDSISKLSAFVKKKIHRFVDWRSFLVDRARTY
jgi:hypothetical protein